MHHYLMVYDRSEGRVLRMDRFTDARAALRERFNEENRQPKDVEVVVLSAASEDALRRTHARYFRPVKDLVRGMSALRIA